MEGDVPWPESLHDRGVRTRLAVTDVFNTAVDVPHGTKEEVPVVSLHGLRLLHDGVMTAVQSLVDAIPAFEKDAAVAAVGIERRATEHEKDRDGATAVSMPEGRVVGLHGEILRLRSALRDSRHSEEAANLLLRRREAVLDELRETLWREVVQLREQLHRATQNPAYVNPTLLSLFDFVKLSAPEEEGEAAKELKAKHRKMQEDLHRATSALTSQINKKDALLAQQRAQLTALKQENARLNKSLSSEQFAGGERLSSLAEELQGRDEELALLKAQHAALQEVADKRAAALRNYESQLQKTAHDAGRMLELKERELISRAQKESEAKQKAADAEALRQQVSILQRTVEEFRADAQAKANEMAELQRQFQQEQLDKADVLEQLLDLQKAGRTASAGASPRAELELKRSQADLRKAKEDLFAARDAADNAKAQLSAMQSDFTHERGQHRVTNRQLEEARSEVEMIRRQLNILRASVAESKGVTKLVTDTIREDLEASMVASLASSRRRRSTASSAGTLPEDPLEASGDDTGADTGGEAGPTGRSSSPRTRRGARGKSVSRHGSPRGRRSVGSRRSVLTDASQDEADNARRDAERWRATASDAKVSLAREQKQWAVERATLQRRLEALGGGRGRGRSSRSASPDMRGLGPDVPTVDRGPRGRSTSFGRGPWAEQLELDDDDVGFPGEEGLQAQLRATEADLAVQREHAAELERQLAGQRLELAARARRPSEARADGDEVDALAAATEAGIHDRTAVSCLLLGGDAQAGNIAVELADAARGRGGVAMMRCPAKDAVEVIASFGGAAEALRFARHAAAMRTTGPVPIAVGVARSACVVDAERCACIGTNATIASALAAAGGSSVSSPGRQRAPEVLLVADSAMVPSATAAAAGLVHRGRVSLDEADLLTPGGAPLVVDAFGAEPLDLTASVMRAVQGGRAFRPQPSQRAEFEQRVCRERVLDSVPRARSASSSRPPAAPVSQGTQVTVWVEDRSTQTGDDTRLASARGGAPRDSSEAALRPAVQAVLAGDGPVPRRSDSMRSDSVATVLLNSQVTTGLRVMSPALGRKALTVQRQLAAAARSARDGAPAQTTPRDDAGARDLRPDDRGRAVPSPLPAPVSGGQRRPSPFDHGAQCLQVKGEARGTSPFSSPFGSPERRETPQAYPGVLGHGYPGGQTERALGRASPVAPRRDVRSLAVEGRPPSAQVLVDSPQGSAPPLSAEDLLRLEPTAVRQSPPRATSPVRRGPPPRAGPPDGGLVLMHPAAADPRMPGPRALSAVGPAQRPAPRPSTSGPSGAPAAAVVDPRGDDTTGRSLKDKVARSRAVARFFQTVGTATLRPGSAPPLHSVLAAPTVKQVQLSPPRDRQPHPT